MKNRYWLKGVLMFALAVCIVSCKDRRHDAAQRMVKEWSNRELLFPEHPVFTCFVRDTVPYRIPPSDYKVVVYVDSVDCLSCRLQLSRWKDFIHEVDSLSGISIPFLFFFHTDRLDELRFVMKTDGFSLPVCIDTGNEFANLNRFPRELMFQAFLVDSANRVRVIGNPVQNLSVRHLYLQKLSGMEIPSCPATTVEADSSAYHLGVINSEGTVRKEVTLHNTGKESFRVEGVTTSCDCITAEYGWNEIPPGGSQVMTVIYRAEEPGDFWRTVTVYGNVPEKSITMDFWGTVRQ